MPTYRYRIQGRVQGVGYRHFATQVADSFDIRGWVRNTDDGAVEVLASGSEENLRSFREQLEIGPSSARVERFDASPSEDSPDLDSFTVRR